MISSLEKNIKKHLTTKFLCDILIRLISRCGGIGRRHGLKIRWEAIPVPVRVRLSAPYSLLKRVISRSRAAW